MEGWFSICKSINMIHHANKSKNHIIISIDTKNAFDKIQHLLFYKTLNQVGTEGMYLNIIIAIYHKPVGSIILNGEMLKSDQYIEQLIYPKRIYHTPSQLVPTTPTLYK